MATERMQRRLAAILAADVVGYSRLMGLDEAGTLRALKGHRQAVIDPKVSEYSGRVVKLMGDGILVEFPSVVEALRCAVDMVRGVSDRNAAVPEERRVHFRIGINVGDIIIEDDDIYGDGVNLAARLQELADPGGICVSRAVRDQVRDKLDVLFDDLGERAVKNIARPLRVFRVAPAAVPEATPDKANRRRTGPCDKPSIAVLPFDNMSSDPEQDFFADGLTEDLITELSRFHDLTVIARNSTFTYKGRAVKAQQVAAELGVRYMVEGSVRRAAGRVRVTVQLIDAASGEHVWAERYDRRFDDIFDLQDEIVHTIVATLPGRLAAVEGSRRKRPSDLAAYDCVTRAKVLHHRGSLPDNQEALRLLDRAIELDPTYAHAHAWKACVLGQAWVRGYQKESDGVLDRVGESLERAYAIDENDCECHRILAAWNLLRRNHDKVAYHQERGLALNPNYDLMVVQQGELLTWLGRGDEAAEWIERAMRLNPYHPERFWTHLGRALYVAGRYAEALRAYEHVAACDFALKANLAACHAELGQAEEARALAAETLALKPDFSSDGYVQTLPYKEESDRARHLASLVKAGLPA